MSRPPVAPLLSPRSLAENAAADRAKRDAADYAADRAARSADYAAGRQRAAGLFREARRELDRILIPDYRSGPSDPVPIFARPYDAPLDDAVPALAHALGLIGEAVRAHDGIPAVRAAVGWRFAPHFESGECLPLDPARHTPADLVGRLGRATDPAVADLLPPCVRLAVELALDAARQRVTPLGLAYVVCAAPGARAALGWLPTLVALLDPSESLACPVRAWGDEFSPGVGRRWARLYGDATGRAGLRLAWLAAGVGDAGGLFPALSPAEPEGDLPAGSDSAGWADRTPAGLAETPPVTAAATTPALPIGEELPAPGRESSAPAVPGEGGELAALADELLKGKEHATLLEIAEAYPAGVPLGDLAIRRKWPNPADNWNSARKRINRKLKRRGWHLETRNNRAIAVRSEVGRK